MDFAGDFEWFTSGELLPYSFTEVIKIVQCRDVIIMCFKHNVWINLPEKQGMLYTT